MILSYTQNIPENQSIWLVEGLNEEWYTTLEDTIRWAHTLNDVHNSVEEDMEFVAGEWMSDLELKWMSEL